MDRLLRLRRQATAPRPTATCAVTLSVTLAVLAAACTSSTHGSSEGSGNGSSAGSCAARSASEYLAQARIAFIGTMLPGPTASLGVHHILVSPAHVRVIRYLKGGGPAVVTVATGISDSGDTANEDGIEPVAGQRWKIYISARQMPYQTSICDGTKPMNKTP